MPRLHRSRRARARRLAPLTAAALLALGLPLVGAGCAGPPRGAAPATSPTAAGSPTPAAKAPAPGAPAWLELRTDHFVLQTDLPAGEAWSTIFDFELTRALLVRALKLEPEPADRFRIVAFGSREDLLAITGQPGIQGEAYAGRDGRQLLLVAGFHREREWIVAHELTHALSLRAYPRQPRWLAEGLATFYSSLGENDRQGRRRPGRPPPWMEQELRAGEELTPVRQLLAWNAGEETTSKYLSSWILVRTLATEQPAAFAELLQRLGRGEPSTLAFGRAFPQWSPGLPGGMELLDRALRDRATRPVPAFPEVRFELPPIAHREGRPMSEADVHTLRLNLPRRWEPADLEQELAAALRADPAHVLALSWMAADRAAPRLELARRAIRAHPEDPDAWALLATALEGAEADDARRRAVERAPDRVDLRVALARSVSGRSPPEAERLAQEAALAAPWSAGAASVRGFALAGMGRCDEARQELQRSRELDVLDPTERDRRDAAAVETELARTCGSAIRLRARTLLGEARSALADSDEERALAIYDEVVELDPGHPDAWRERGWALRSLRRFGEAEAAFRRQLELSPEDPFAWNDLGALLLSQARWAEAEAALRRGLKLAPDLVRLRENLAEVLLDLGRPQEAVTALERAVAQQPRNTMLRVELARVRLAAGDRARGLADLEEAVALGREASEGQQAATLNNAAFTLADAPALLDQARAWGDLSIAKHLGDLAKRGRWRPTAAEADAGVLLSAAWDTVGWVHFQQGRLEDAARWVSACLAARPSAEGARHLGRILEAQGRREDARATYALALALGPDPEAARRLEALATEPGERDRLLAEARTETLRRRLLQRRPAPAAAEVDERILLVLGPDGRVSGVLPAVGRAVPGADAVRGARHPIPFLPRDLPRLVVPGRYRCAGGECAWLLGADPVPDGPLP
jgi:tetratricopeptide (TPR) repeat protein